MHSMQTLKHRPTPLLVLVATGPRGPRGSSEPGPGVVVMTASWASDICAILPFRSESPLWMVRRTLPLTPSLTLTRLRLHSSLAHALFPHLDSLTHSLARSFHCLAVAPVCIAGIHVKALACGWAHSGAVVPTSHGSEGDSDLFLVGGKKLPWFVVGDFDGLVGQLLGALIQVHVLSCHVLSCLVLPRLILF